MAEKIIAPYKSSELEVEHLDYTDDEIDYRGFLIGRMVAAKNAREQEHTEFDDMDYVTYYETNAKAAYSYIKPKKNKEDTRLVTGTTREKEHTLLSTILNFNFQPNINAFDEEDRPIAELGDNMQDLVKKSREIEEYEHHRALIYKEMLDQGTCFVEENWVENPLIEKILENTDWRDGMKINKIKWSTKKAKQEGICEVNLLAGTKVFLGNIKEFFMQKQPFVFTAERITWEEVRLKYGDWERFKYVPKVVQFFGEVPTDTGDSTYRNWTLYETEEKMVEVLKYQDKWANEYMLMINGVMMLPVGFPLSAVSPSGDYLVAKGDSEPISKFFAYSKSIPAKTKVDQSVMDEMLKLFILKFQKSIKPPMANNTGRVLSRDIFLPAKIVSGIDPAKLQPIGDVQSINQAEFALFDLMKRIVDEKTVSATMSGDITRQDTTATEIMEAKRQAMLKMGYAMVGTLMLEHRLAWLRVHNILQHWTEPIDTRVTSVRKQLQDVYRTVSVNTTLENGADGLKMIEFNEQMAMAPPEHIKNIEDLMSERMGRTVRKVYLNPKLLRKLKFKWYITINPTEKDASEIKRATFLKNISDAMAIFGPQSLNLDYLKDRFAGIIGEDPERMFVRGAPMGMPMEGGAQPNQIQQQMAQGVVGPRRQPSVNTLARA